MNNTCNGNIKLFACNANTALANSIAQELNLAVGDSVTSRFSDGEINLRINETVRGKDVFIIQSTSPPVNDHLMELLIMIDAMRRASAGRITAVIPYFGYARQDRKARAHDPISAKLVADIITKAGADRVLTMDLHCAQIQGFFDIPVDHLKGMPLFARYYEKSYRHAHDAVAVSPDLGSVSRVRALAERLNIPLAIVDKRRQNPNESEVLNIVGDIKGKRTILLDDMIDTAGSIVNAAEALMERGALEVNACCTHAVLSGAAIDRLKASPIKELVALDTIPLTNDKSLDKIVPLSVAPLFAAAISCIHESRPVSNILL